MSDASHDLQRYRPPGNSFQFSLRHLFWMTLLVAIYFAVLRVTGSFVATMLLAMYAVSVTITILRIDNVLVGGITGTAISTLLLLACGLAVGPPGWLFVATCLVFPILGYAVGYLTVVNRQLQLG